MVDVPADLVDAADLFLMQERLWHLKQARVRPGYDRTFIDSVSKMDPAKFSVRQALHVMKLAWTYRHQLPQGMAPLKRPGDLPRAPKLKTSRASVREAKEPRAAQQGSLL